MLQRRNFFSSVACAGIAAAASAISPGAWAQRPAQPIARPPRPGGAALAGRFNADGVASGSLPGVYMVVAVNPKAETLQLRDADGRTALVRVPEHLFELETLKPGDEVEVDFVVPQPGITQPEAGALWKVQR